MQFQNSPPSSNQLLHLRNRLFQKHLIISLPSIIILILIFHLSPLLAPYPALQPPELKAPSILTKYYQQLFDYSVFYANLAQMLYVTQLQTSNYLLDDLREKYKDIEVGMYCINTTNTNTSVICNKFVGLSMMSWQYQNSHALSVCISSITICDKSTLGCVSTIQSANWQVGILRGAGQCGSQLVLNDSSYILSCTQNLRILIRLVEIQSIHVEVLKDIQLSYYKYYQISINAPISKSVFQYGSVDTSSALQQQTYTAQQSTFILQIKVNMQRNVKHMQYIAIFSGSVSLILIMLVFKHEKDRITSWLTFNFSRKHLINRLYRYTIRDIFTGQKPNPSNILQSGPSSNLFLTLSSLIDKSLISIELEQKKPAHRQSFKFLNTLKIVFDGYKQSINPLMQSKNRYILTNRFNLQTSINDMFEVESKVIKEQFTRGAELGIEKEMFRFGYMAVLRNQQQFVNFLQSDQKPMPKKLQKLFLKINASIHNPTALSQKLLQQQQQLEIARSEQEQHYLEQNKQQLQLRTRVYIIPKYLTLLKQLDSKNNYAEQLRLERQLKSLAEIIENTRFMLTRHNKTIRGFSK